MATTGSISLQSTADPNVCAYHTRFEMSCSNERGTRGDSGELSEFGKMILRIRGVAMVQVTPYLLLITKGQMFEWPEVQPEVETILKIFNKSQCQLEDYLEKKQ